MFETPGPQSGLLPACKFCAGRGQIAPATAADRRTICPQCHGTGLQPPRKIPHE